MGMSLLGSSTISARVLRLRRRLGEARARSSCLELEEDGGRAWGSFKLQGDEVGMVQPVDVVLRRSSGEALTRGRCFNGGRGERALPWLELERERGWRE